MTPLQRQGSALSLSGMSQASVSSFKNQVSIHSVYPLRTNEMCCLAIAFLCFCNNIVLELNSSVSYDSLRNERLSSYREATFTLSVEHRWQLTFTLSVEHRWHTTFAISCQNWKPIERSSVDKSIFSRPSLKSTTKVSFHNYRNGVI